MSEFPLNFMKIIESVLEENEAFCKSNEIGHETELEIVELMNDAIDNVVWEVKEIDWRKLFSKYAMLNYFFSILMPVSYGIYFDYLGGNLPMCFTQLRALLEQLAKCFMSDARHPDLPFFQERIVALEKEMERDHMTLTKLIETVAPEGASMWRSLSRDWVHFKSFDRIVAIISGRQDVPGWSLTVPIGYSDTELPEIVELGKCVSGFRQILGKNVEEWKRRSFTDS
jgi:hypothetical protein